MGVISLGCWSLLEVLKYLLVVRGVLGFQIRAGWKKYLIILYILAGIPLFRLMTDGRSIYMATLGVVFLLFFFNERLTDLIKAFVLAKLLISIVELFAWSVLVNYFPGIVSVRMDLLPWIKGIGWSRMEGILLGIVIWICVISAVQKKRERIYDYFVELSFGWTIVIAIILWGLDLIAKGLQEGLDIYYTGWQKEMILLIFMSGILLLAVVGVVFVYTMVSKKKLKQMHQMEKENLYLQQKYYEGKLQLNEEIQRFRHDMMKHMKVIRLLCEKGEVEELKEYVEDFLVSYPERDVVYTGNIIADYFISETISELGGREGFHYRVMGRFPEKTGLSDTELCILMANALENARNAIRRVDGPSELSVEIKNYKGHIVIGIQNTKTEKDPREEPDERRENGGYGMKNMKSVVEKHGGSIDIQETADQFRLQIFL